MKFIKSRSQDIEISKDNPFANDKLGRSSVCNILTDVVSFYGQSGCVMALDGAWGSGKTTFVKMWQQHLENEGYRSLYFNAWASDYTEDPLMALVSELSKLSPNNDTINKIATDAVRIGLSALKSILKRTTGVDCDAIHDAIDETFNIGKEYLKEYSEQKTKLEEFKNDVQKYVANNATEHPVVFFIDELDRCNPHYAVAVLERIKHLFEIPNIIFILAINKRELCNAIQGYYGSSQIDSGEYLRRFIDINYELPQPEIDKYCDYLFDEYGFDDFFNNTSRIRGNSDDKKFKQIALDLCKGPNVNLRQMDRIFAYSRLILTQFNYNDNIQADIYFLLCFWKVMDVEFYNQLANKEFTVQELLTVLEEKLPKSMLAYENSHWNYVYTIACLLYCYDISTNGYRTQKPTVTITQNRENNKIECPITSKYLDKDEFNIAMDYYYNRNRYGHTTLWYIYSRIDLLHRFN